MALYLCSSCCGGRKGVERWFDVAGLLRLPLSSPLLSSSGVSEEEIRVVLCGSERLRGIDGHLLGGGDLEGCGCWYWFVGRWIMAMTT